MDSYEQFIQTDGEFVPLDEQHSSHREATSWNLNETHIFPLFAKEENDC